MPPKNVSSLADMLSDGSDVDMVDAHNENEALPKKVAKAPVKKARKTKPASKRLSGGKKKPAAKAVRRAPLTDRSNDQQRGEDTEEVDEFAEEHRGTGPEAEDVAGNQEADIEQPNPAAKKRGRPAKKATAISTAAKRKAQDDDSTNDSAHTNPKNRPAGSKITSAARSQQASEKAGLEAELDTNTVIADSQQAPVDLDKSALRDDQLPQSQYRQESRARQASRQLLPRTRPMHQRSGSISDTDRGSDPGLRRKLGDMTKKFETMQMRYNKLHEIGIKEAEANFERLKQQSQAQEDAANALVASLKAELAAARKDASQNASLSSQISKAKELAKASDDKLRTSEAQLATVTEKLSLAQSETKSLQAKLVATRQANHDVNGSARVPGSAVKGKNAVNDRAAAAQAAVAQLKEDLYSDLTGLIVRGVEKTDEADVFDCIQTGRNGTLHFRLAIDTLDASASYADTEFQYTPRLDEERDRDLLEILPDYLTEEITFSRENAAKFYSRITETLTSKME